MNRQSREEDNNNFGQQESASGMNLLFDELLENDDNDNANDMLHQDTARISAYHSVAGGLSHAGLSGHVELSRYDGGFPAAGFPTAGFPAAGIPTAGFSTAGLLAAAGYPPSAGFPSIHINQHPNFGSTVAIKADLGESCKQMDAVATQILQNRQSAPRTAQKTSKGTSFPSKLLHMLEQAEAEGYEDIISFLPDGKAFMIHQPDKFAQEVLPKYSRTSRFSSFQKQLNLYGFKRIGAGSSDVGALYHEFFQRDNKKLVAKIQRKKQPVPGGEGSDLFRERDAILRAFSSARKEACLQEEDDDEVEDL